MISTILNYSLNASAKTITFTDYGNIQLARIVLIRNLTTNQWIYKVTDTAAFGGSVSTNVLTFTASNIGMNNGDLLEIRYDTPTSLDTQQVSGTFWQLTQPVSIVSMPSTPVTGTFWQATQPVSIAGTVVVSGTFWQATQPISGTVTANIGSTNGLALDATLTGGTVKAILRGGAKGSTSAADVTSVSVDANTQAIHANITNFPATQPISGSVSVSNFPATQAVTGTFWQSTQPVSIAATVIIKADTAGNQANALKVDGSAVTQPVSGTFWQSTQPVSIATLPSLATGSNTIGSVKITDGTNTAAVLNSAPGSDTGQSAIAVRIISSLAAAGGAGTQYVNGVANAGPTGTLSLGYDGANLRALKTDNSGILSVNFTNASLAVTGTFWQSTQPVSISSTVGTNIAQINGVTPLMGNGITGTGSLRVTIASDNTAFAVNAAQSGTWNIGTLTSITNTVVIKADTAGNQANALKVDGSAVTQPVSGTFWQNTQPVSIAASVAVTGTFWQSTQPVSIATLPALVAGSALIGGVNLVDSAGSNKASISAAGAIKVDNSAVTQPISATALPLPSNAAQETGGNLATIATNQATATNQTTANTTLTSINTLLQALNIAQGIVNSNQTGPLVQGLVDDAPSTYTSGTIQPVSLTPEGRIRVATVQADITQIWNSTFDDPFSMKDDSPYPYYGSSLWF